MVEYDDGSENTQLYLKIVKDLLIGKNLQLPIVLLLVADLPAEIATILYKQGLPKTAEKVVYDINK